MFELMDSYSQNAVIKVLGVGGGGGNAVQHMVEANIEGVDFICANTDAQALEFPAAEVRNDVPQAVVAAMATAAFQARRACFQIDFIALVSYRGVPGNRQGNLGEHPFSEIHQVFVGRVGPIKLHHGKFGVVPC